VTGTGQQYYIEFVTAPARYRAFIMHTVTTANFRPLGSLPNPSLTIGVSSACDERRCLLEFA